MIEMSVILPMFRSKYIGWLPFEGLIRQRKIAFDWELIIAEEINDPEKFGWQQIEKYQKSLEATGCARIEYIPVKKWMPLGSKLSMMVKHVSENSIIYVGHSADYYSAPGRLAAHYEVLSGGRISHHLPTRAIHYSIGERRAILQDTRGKRRKDHVIGRATRMELMRGLPNKGPRKGNDAWMFRCMQNTAKKISIPFKIKFDNSGRWRHALSTFGFNNLSPIRLRKSAKDYPVSEIRKRIPAEIIDRLDSLRPQLKNHRHLGRGKKKRR